MLQENDVVEAISMDLLSKGYAILRVPASKSRDVDLIAQEPGPGARVFISVAGEALSRVGRGRLQEEHSESQLFRSITKSVHGAMRIRGAKKFRKGDRIVLAFPDVPGFRKYVVTAKPVLDSLGIKVFLVNERKEVHVL